MAAWKCETVFGHVSSCLEGGEGGAEKQCKLATAVELSWNKMEGTNVYLLVVKFTFRFRLKISSLMEISEITS